MCNDNAVQNFMNEDIHSSCFETAAIVFLMIISLSLRGMRSLFRTNHTAHYFTCGLKCIFGYWQCFHLRLKLVFVTNILFGNRAI